MAEKAKTKALNLLDELKGLLQKDQRFVIEKRLNKNIIVEHALKLDGDLLKLLLSNKKIKEHFFVDIAGTVIFDKDKFLRFVDNKQFLPDSYTAFKNKIGFTIGNDYLKERKDVTLVWPYKDCVLEGGQTKEDQKRNEIFWNETLAPDEIDRLLCPKTLTAFKRYDCEGQHKGDEIKDTDNLLIKGNNLLALYTLKKRFAGKVKLIYIDPPYKTNNDSFKYNDSFRGSTWLTFMKNRLDVARDLLASEGVIFVQISDIEVARLRLLLDEVFGEDNFINQITVKTRSPSGFKTVNLGVFESAEYLFCYGKRKNLWKYNEQYIQGSYDPQYRYLLLNPNDKPNKWEFTDIASIVAKEHGFDSSKKAVKTMGKAIFLENLSEFALANNKIVFRLENIGDDAGTETVKIRDKSKSEGDKVFWVKRDNKEDRYIVRGQEIAFYGKKIRIIDGKKMPTTKLTNIWTDISWEGIAAEGGVKLKKGKKPEKLLRRIIDMSTEKGDIVMDFFCGSGTTAAVAHKMERQYIGIEQIDYGENDSVTRLHNVIGKKIKKEGKLIDDLEFDTSGISKAVNWQGGGEFIYCELMQWNEVFVQKIRKTKTKKEHSVIWQEMKEKAHLSYMLDVESFDENATDFEQLAIDQQKAFLLETLDKNQLYVNYSEIDDEDYKVRREDKELNKQFYKN